MDLFSVFTLCGGLAFFLFGMHIMSSSLEKIAGGRLELTLKKLTSNPFKSLLLGAGITIAIQSSSALTVMLVGLVNSGIMALPQTVGIIMGSNIGTTLTAWILSMTGIETDSIFLALLKPENFSPLLALIGVIMLMVCKSDKRRDIGSILCGFSVLMFGMNLMSDAVSPLAEMPEFESMLTRFNNPLVGVLVGTVFTGIIQSSAASVGILQALSLTGAVSYAAAIPLILGQNIGTTVTALLSSIGTNKSARRVAAIHVSFNFIGTVVCLVLFYGLNTFLHFSIVSQSITPVAIAGVHSIFNLVTTLMLLPFSNQLVKLANILVPEKAGSKEETVFLDERIMNAPMLAVEQCREKAVSMAVLAQSAMQDAMGLITHYTQAGYDAIEQKEQALDKLDDELATALVKLSARELRVEDSHQVFELLHAIGDFERIGDHILNLQQSAKELHDKQLRFSDAAREELAVLTHLMQDILDASLSCFREDDPIAAQQVEPLEETMDCLTDEIRSRHIRRLQTGECTIQLGFVLNDLLNNFERVSDHCSNIAVSVIEERDSHIAAHAYLHDMKKNGEFAVRLQQNLKRYALPAETAEPAPQSVEE